MPNTLARPGQRPAVVMPGPLRDGFVCLELPPGRHCSSKRADIGNARVWRIDLCHGIAKRAPRPLRPLNRTFPWRCDGMPDGSDARR